MYDLMPLELLQLSLPLLFNYIKKTRHISTLLYAKWTFCFLQEFTKVNLTIYYKLSSSDTYLGFMGIAMISL